MTAIYNDYPYWRYTVSELGVRHGLLGDSPIPNIGPQADQYHKIKGYGETCKFIIDEPVEANIPGPESPEGITVFKKLHELLDTYKISAEDVHMISPAVNFEELYTSWCEDNNEKQFIGNRHVYPFYFLTEQRKYEYVRNFNHTRNKHLMSLNGAVKPKRLKFIKFCKNHGLMNNYISLVANYNTTDKKVTPIELDVGADELSKNDKAVPLKLMEDSWLNIINETHEDKTVFFTEKTWKPILNLQLFLYYGVGNPQAYYNALRSYGFELYDEILDYSNSAEHEIFKFSLTSLQEWADKIDKVKDKMLYNQNLALNTNWKELFYEKEYNSIWG